MKRRLAWFMAVLMCVTGVPQGTFLSMAAEDNLTETETLQAEESEENISLTAETEDSLSPEETETAVAETMTAETGETETVASGNRGDQQA